MGARKVTFIRNPHIRQLIVTVLILALVFTGLSFLPFGIVWWVLGILGILIGGAVSVLLLICIVLSVRYWVRTGELYSPWAMSPWGRGPWGGRNNG